MLRRIGISLFLALICAKTAAAALTLEFWQGEQNFTPFVPDSPSFTNPASLEGLRNWNFTGQSKLTSLNLAPGQQFILKIVLRDHDSEGDGSGYTISGAGLMVFAVNFGYVPGVLDATRDFFANDIADTLTVWNGDSDSTASTRENHVFAMANSGPSSFTIGSLFDFPANKEGVSPFQQPDGDVLYPLANVVLTSTSVGSGSLALSKPTTFPPTFQGFDGTSTVDYDLDIWGFDGTNTNLLPIFVPEPSSLFFGCLVIPSIFLRRKLNRRRR